jgi:hypothetical protein
LQVEAQKNMSHYCISCTILALLSKLLFELHSAGELVELKYHNTMAAASVQIIYFLEMLKYSSKKGFLKKISFVKENEESLEIFCF